MHFFTGSHKDYHRPSDDSKSSTSPACGMAEMVPYNCATLAEAPASRSQYESKSSEPVLGGGGDRPYFGSIPDFAGESRATP